MEILRREDSTRTTSDEVNPRRPWCCLLSFIPNAQDHLEDYFRPSRAPERGQRADRARLSLTPHDIIDAGHSYSNTSQFLKGFHQILKIADPGRSRGQVPRVDPQDHSGKISVAARARCLAVGLNRVLQFRLTLLYASPRTACGPPAVSLRTTAEPRHSPSSIQHNAYQCYCCIYVFIRGFHQTALVFTFKRCIMTSTRVEKGTRRALLGQAQPSVCVTTDLGSHVQIAQQVDKETCFPRNNC